MNLSPPCSFCSKSASQTFCPCTLPEVFLCNLCAPLHSAHFPGAHRLLPLCAFGPHRSPDYFSRLQSRRDLLISGSQKLTQNVKEIDRCIAAIYEELNSVTRAIWDYGQKIIVDLEAAKAAIEINIKVSIEEVEKTIYEETPRLAGEFSECLRTGGTLAPFQYQFTVSTDLESIVRVDYNTSGIVTDMRIPQIVLSSLQCFNPRTRRTVASTLPVSLPFGYVCCLLDNSSLFAAGGGEPPTCDAHIVDLERSAVRDVNAMSVARTFPGLVSNSGCVYAFGGSDGRSDIAACEKFTLSEQRWASLSDMSTPKARFCPCAYEADIYLPQFSRSVTAIESFSTATEEFRLLEMALPAANSTHSVSFVVGGDLVVISSGGEVYRQGAGGKFRMERVDAQGKGSFLSSLSPIIAGRRVYWVRADDGQLVQYQLGVRCLQENR